MRRSREGRRRRIGQKPREGAGLEPRGGWNQEEGQGRNKEEGGAGDDESNPMPANQRRGRQKRCRGEKEGSTRRKRKRRRVKATMGHSSGESNPGESTRRRRRVDATRDTTVASWTQEKGRLGGGRGGESTRRWTRVDKEKGRWIEQGHLWLCSFLYFLNYIACIYVQTQGRPALPWENLFIFLESLCDEVRNETLNLFLR